MRGLDGESKLRANLTATGRALLVRRGTDAVSGASLTHPATHGIATDPERVQSKTRPACSSSSRRNHFIKTPSMFIAQAGQTDIVMMAFCPANSTKSAATDKVKCAPVAGHLACGKMGK
jgi:hypothetical protein